MNQITKKQHFVPRFYLKFWTAPGENFLFLYDLKEEEIHKSRPQGVLAEKYYYEHDRESPDNSVENVLSHMESETAQVVASINEIVQKYRSYSQERRLLRDLQDLLTSEARSVLKEFMAYQYLRVPGAIERKEFELQPAAIPKNVLNDQLKPANFVTSGWDHIKERFLNKLKMLICCSLDNEFVTSDWPCFEFRHSLYAPIFGQEVGAASDVFLVFPLLPRVLLTLYLPAYFITGITHAPELIVKSMSAGNVKNNNSLIIQQARRWVIYNKREDFVFQVARKRLKAPK
jgi:hypothetical protein